MLRSMGSQRVGRSLATEQQQQQINYFKSSICIQMFLDLFLIFYIVLFLAMLGLSLQGRAFSPVTAHRLSSCRTQVS